MFDTVCTFPLESDLFAQAVHPTAPLITVGLASGHVAALRLPPVDGDDNDDDDDDDDNDNEKIVKSSKSSKSGQLTTRRGSNNGTGFIDTAWRTKRHKGSCRCLAYSLDGSQLYSTGTDGIVKAADSATGQVTSKIAIPLRTTTTTTKDPIDSPTVLHALSPQTLILATDSGALHLYDLRSATPPSFADSRPAQTYHPHTDYVSSLAPIPASTTSTSGFSKQWLTTGSTTLALTDLRRGVLAKSEDQEELLLSCVYATGLPARRGGTSTSEKAVVGGGDGVLTLWQKGQWDDQDERIVVSREKETLDCLAHVPEGVAGPGRVRVAVGMGDGRVRFVRLGVNKVVGEVRHDEQEGVVQLGFDASGRMISGGGQTIKVWQEHIEQEAAGEVEDEEGVGGVKRGSGNGNDSGDEEDEGEEQDDSSDEEDSPRQPRKKRRKGKGPAGGNVKKFDFAGLD